MSEERLARIEADIATIKGMLQERCAAREVRLMAVEHTCVDLRSCEDKRKGGMAAIGAICAASAAVGGLVVKFFPKMGG